VLSEEPTKVPIEDRIDLHTFQPREIKSVVEEYLFQAVERGFRQVRIIHGRGIGVQREMVRRTLSENPDVLGYEDVPDRGATVAYLRPRR
jgi:DNA-nicking Smr family endonuclease